jgi:predicted phosphohydrolase
MKFLVMTDTHLDHCSPELREDFMLRVSEEDLPIVSLGDIGTSWDYNYYLTEIAKLNAPNPTYYIMGNHDYYKGDLGNIYSNQYAQYLAPSMQPIHIEKNTFLIGSNGWASGHYNFRKDFPLADFDNIATFRNPENRYRFMNFQSRHYAFFLQANIKEAILMGAEKIVVVTHVPPFEEACFFKGALTDNDHLPYFCNVSSGDALRFEARQNPMVKFEVYAGHTHHASKVDILSNLSIEVLGATYGKPEYRIINF